MEAFVAGVSFLGFNGSHRRLISPANRRNPRAISAGFGDGSSVEKRV
jgi:hypothetical protein